MSVQTEGVASAFHDDDTRFRTVFAKKFVEGEALIKRDGVVLVSMDEKERRGVCRDVIHRTGLGGDGLRILEGIPEELDDEVVGIVLKDRAQRHEIRGRVERENSSDARLALLEPNESREVAAG